MAHASVFGNEEKVAIVRRVIRGMIDAGAERILYMPDPYQMIPQAIDGLGLERWLTPVEGTFRSSAADTTSAAAAMAAGGARVIVSLGGDGTNRALAKGTCDVPLIPVSTGTNNVFPVMVEGTVVGLAAGAIAAGTVSAEAVSERCKRIDVAVDGVPRDLALIDAAVLDGIFVGSRAVWDLSKVREAVMTRSAPDAIGLSAIGGMVETVRSEDEAGLHIVLAQEGDPVERRLRAAIAPGLIEEVVLASTRRLELGATVCVDGPAMFALDGEREFAIKAGERASLCVTRTGPPVVAIDRCLEAARDAGFLRMD